MEGGLGFNCFVKSDRRFPAFFYAFPEQFGMFFLQQSPLVTRRDQRFTTYLICFIKGHFKELNTLSTFETSEQWEMLSIEVAFNRESFGGVISIHFLNNLLF